jgi:exonuclease VII large subunit
MNKITVTGKVSYFKKHSEKFATFSLADSNYMGKDQDGKGKYSNAYLQCMCFGHALNKIEKAGGDEAEIVVEGVLIQEEYKGEKRFKIQVKDCLLAVGGSTAPRNTQSHEAPPADDDDDCPF